ncbi:MAG TPA: ABC transporter permease [Anaerolineae bacterium]|nr:ABC transporter permease [Anaerolineae bacterium]
MLTAWTAVSLTFFALRLIAGDPIASLLSQGLASPDQVENLRRSLGLDAPLFVQYLNFLAGFFRGDLGTSLFTGRPVSTVIVEQLPATAQLAFAGLGFALLFGLTLGVISAWKEETPLGQFAASLAGLATALPVAFTGILGLILYRQLLVVIPLLSVVKIRRLFLPALLLGFASAGAIARVVQAGLKETMKGPYILAARARGIEHGFRLLWHALRPALPPVVSLTALEAAFLFAGTVVTETVFSRPGLGRLLVTSILQGDYPIAQGLVVLAAVFYTISHMLADILAFTIDPRLRRVT